MRVGGAVRMTRHVGHIVRAGHTIILRPVPGTKKNKLHELESATISISMANR